MKMYCFIVQDIICGFRWLGATGGGGGKGCSITCKIAATQMRPRRAAGRDGFWRHPTLLCLQTGPMSR